MSLRIVPEATHSKSFSHIRSTANIAPSAPGLHDTLRAGLGPDPFTTTAAPTSSHPLESRLKQWEKTQDSLRMESLRRTFGIAEPIRRGMELQITRGGEWRPMVLGGGCSASVSEDILRGREATIEWEDVFTGEEQRGVVGVHEEMERKLKV